MNYFKKSHKTDVLYWRVFSNFSFRFSTVDIVDNSVDKSVFQHFSVFFFVDNCKELYTDTLFFFTLCKFMYISLSIMHNFQPFLIENPFLTIFWKYSLLSDILPKVLDFSVEILLLFPKQKAEYSCKNRKITHIKNQVTDFLHWKFRKTNIICHRTFFHSVYKITKSSSKK